MNKRTILRSRGKMFGGLCKASLKLTCVVALVPVLGFTQGRERKIDKVSWRNEPIKLLGQKTKGKEFKLGEKFLEGDDWLRGLTVTARNVSDKPVARIVITLAFPRPEGTAEDVPTYTVGMMYGRDPAEAVEGKRPPQIAPGETVEVKLLEVNLPFIKEDLKTLGYPENVTHARITVDTVTFYDGTMWAGGDIFYPDPAEPTLKRNPNAVPDPERDKRPPSRSAAPPKSPAPPFRNASFLLPNLPSPPQQQ